MAIKVIYWLTTSLLAFAYLMGGYFDIALLEPVIQSATHLGYPLYFFKILGFWKLLAVFAILMPGMLRLKEWAYAGIFFNLTGAAATHVFVKDGIGEVITPLVVLAIAMTSWASRPASRKLPGPLL